MAARAVENVWSYPRPPALLKTPARLRVIWNSPDGSKITIADTKEGYRVLETSHPPTYYFPPSSVQTSFLKVSNARQTMCEWKGRALYHDLLVPGTDKIGARARIWSYPSPTPQFTPIKDYLCFYASSNSDKNAVGSWTCMVDEDVVQPQEGDFYGSWITPEITGGEKGFKGGAGTWGW